MFTQCIRLSHSLVEPDVAGVEVGSYSYQQLNPSIVSLVLTITEPRAVRSEEPRGAKRRREVVHLGLWRVSMHFEYHQTSNKGVCIDRHPATQRTRRLNHIDTHRHGKYSTGKRDNVGKSELLLAGTKEEGGPDEVEGELGIVQLEGSVCALPITCQYLVRAHAIDE